MHGNNASDDKDKLDAVQREKPVILEPTGTRSETASPPTEARAASAHAVAAEACAPGFSFGLLN